jgi:predicted GNAT family acetyltransferase
MMRQKSGKVVHNEDGRQFEMPVPGGLAVLRYTRDAEKIDLLHTLVPPEDEGNGHGTTLVQAAFDYARKANIEVVPTCPFVRAYVDKHPEQQDIVAVP